MADVRLEDYDDEELDIYAQQITDQIEPLQEEAHRIAAERNTREERRQYELRNRDKSEDEKALDQKFGTAAEEGNDNG